MNRDLSMERVKMINSIMKLRIKYDLTPNEFLAILTYFKTEVNLPVNFTRCENTLVEIMMLQLKKKNVNINEWISNKIFTDFVDSDVSQDLHKISSRYKLIQKLIEETQTVMNYDLYAQLDNKLNSDDIPEISACFRIIEMMKSNM